MTAPARLLTVPPKPPKRKRRPRIVYRVTFEPSRDPRRGEELMRRWLVAVLSE